MLLPPKLQLHRIPLAMRPFWTPGSVLIKINVVFGSQKPQNISPWSLRERNRDFGQLPTCQPPKLRKPLHCCKASSSAELHPGAAGVSPQLSEGWHGAEGFQNSEVEVSKKLGGPILGLSSEAPLDFGFILGAPDFWKHPAVFETGLS